MFFLSPGTILVARENRGRCMEYSTHLNGCMCSRMGWTPAEPLLSPLWLLPPTLGVSRSSFEEVLTWQEADAVLVTPVRHTGRPAICPLKGTPRSLGQGQDAADGSEEKEGGEVMGDGVCDDDKDGKEGTSEKALSSERESCGHLSEGGDFSSQEKHEKTVEEDSDATDEGGRESEVARKTSERPSFVYQRRKFVLNDAVGETGGEDGHGGEGETFGLVELPVEWPLGR